MYKLCHNNTIKTDASNLRLLIRVISFTGTSCAMPPVVYFFFQGKISKVKYILAHLLLETKIAGMNLFCLHACAPHVDV